MNSKGDTNPKACSRMSHKKSCVVLYGPIYWGELRSIGIGIGIGIGLKHVYNQDSWYWS